MFESPVTSVKYTSLSQGIPSTKFIVFAYILHSTSQKNLPGRNGRFAGTCKYSLNYVGVWRFEVIIPTSLPDSESTKEHTQESKD